MLLRTSHACDLRTPPTLRLIKSKNVNTKGSSTILWTHFAFLIASPHSFSSLQSLSKYLSDVKDAPDDRKRLQLEVSNIKGLLSTLQDLAQPGETWLEMVRSLNTPNGPLQQCWPLLKCLDENLAPDPVG